MSKEPKRQGVRVQLDFPESKINELEKIMSKTGIGTRKDLFDNALTFFAWAVDQRQKGRRIGSIDDEDIFYEILMPALASVKNEAENSDDSDPEESEKSRA